MFAIDTYILLAGVLLLVGVLSLRVSTRTGMPMLVVLLGVGMVLGSEGVGRIAFEDYTTAHALGSVALLLILFDGGLNTPVASIRRAWKPSLVLATVGVGLTALLVAGVVHYVLKMPPLVAMLVGSIVASTDAAAVIMALRTAGYRLDDRLSATIELESGTNDPMAIFLTLGMLEVITGKTELGLGLVALFVKQVGLGAAFGLGVGGAVAEALTRVNLRTAGLYPVLAVTGACLAFGGAALLGGSGFLAVYLAGIVIGNRKIRARSSVLQFHDGLAWMAQLGMFLMLGLLSFPSDLGREAGAGLLVALALMFVARPVAVAVCLLPFGFSPRKTLFVTWAGLKGAVPIVLGIYPLLLGVELGHDIFNLVFFAVALSALAQGWSLPWLGRRLRLDQPQDAPPPVSLGLIALRHTDTDIVEYTVSEGAPVAGVPLADVTMPSGALIALVVRGEQTVLPRGDTVLQPHDHLYVMAKDEARPALDAAFVGGDILPQPRP